MNGVCVMFKGYVDVQRLDGAGYLEYDDENSKVPKLFSATEDILGLINHINHIFVDVVILQRPCTVPLV